MVVALCARDQQPVNLNPKALSNRRAGTFLLRLEIKTEAATDYHFVAYLASSGFLVDNCPSQPVLKVDDADRLASNKNAMLVFKKIFPGAARIHMTSVYEFQMCSQISRSIIVIDPATTRSTPTMISLLSCTSINSSLKENSTRLFQFSINQTQVCFMYPSLASIIISTPK